MNKQDALPAMESNPFLRGFLRNHLEKVAEISEVESYDEDEIVFHQGDVADHVYLVASGKLALELEGPAAEHKRIVTLGPGELLGWSSMLQRPRMAASARAIEACQVIKIDSAKLLGICEADAEFGSQFLRKTTLALAKRLNATWDQLSRLHLRMFIPMSEAEDAEN